jgi:hypothetical protein
LDDMRFVFAAGEGRGRQPGALVPLLILALIFCHGFFGGLHLASGPLGVVVSVDDSVAGGHAQHVGLSDGHEVPQDGTTHPGTSDYYAAMLVAAVGLLLWAALGAWSSLEGAMRSGDFVPVAGAPTRARGPDRRALLQVFRL